MGRAYRGKGCWFNKVSGLTEKYIKIIVMDMIKKILNILFKIFNLLFICILLLLPLSIRRTVLWFLFNLKQKIEKIILFSMERIK